MAGDKFWWAERFVASLLALTSFRSYNTGYTANFVCPNRLTPTSYSSKTLYAIAYVNN